MTKIRLSKSVIGEQEKQAVLSVLDKEFLGMGDEVKLFEEKISDFVGRPTVCTNTGTAALHLALESMDIGAGDEVLVPSLTYVASFQAIAASRATPVACDIDPEFLSIDLKDAEKRITKNTKAIMIVHYSGKVANFDAVMDFARAHGLRVIEDAAHAFGSTYKKQRVGSFGDVTCFSFDGIKNITSGEGGAIVTSDAAVLANAKDGRLLGVVKDSDARYQGKRSWDFDVKRQGWRYHMSNIMAAIGIAQLDKYEYLSKKRKELAQLYVSLLKDKEHIVTPVFEDFSDVTPHIFVVKLDVSVDREKLRNKLLNVGIETGIHYQPNHQLSYFKNEAGLSFPVTNQLFPRLLTLPLHPDLTLENINYVVDNLLID